MVESRPYFNYSCFKTIPFTNLLQNTLIWDTIALVWLDKKIKTDRIISNKTEWRLKNGWLLQFRVHWAVKVQTRAQRTEELNLKTCLFYWLWFCSRHTWAHSHKDTCWEPLSGNRAAWPEWTTPVFSFSCMLKHNNRWYAAAACNSLRKWRL